ncbi:MAG: hypothetical protein Q4B28_01825 [bacterium]|nr:hypothetical protein [bacterium]
MIGLTKTQVLHALENYFIAQQGRIADTKVQLSTNLKELEIHSRESDIQANGVICPQSNHWTEMAKTNQEQYYSLKTNKINWLQEKEKLDHGSLLFVEYKDEEQVPQFYRGRKKVIMYLPFGGMILDMQGQEVIIVSYAARCMQHILGLRMDPNIKSFEILAY